MEKSNAVEELISSFPPAGNNYTKAGNQHRCRFGRRKLLLEHLLNLLGIELQKQNTGNTIY